MRTGVAAILVGAALLATTGCTHFALQKRTVKQASTLTDLQYQQVLDNLAMFACNPDALAWHVANSPYKLSLSPGKAIIGRSTGAADSTWWAILGFGLVRMSFSSRFVPARHP